MIVYVADMHSNTWFLQQKCAGGHSFIPQLQLLEVVVTRLVGTLQIQAKWDHNQGLLCLRGNLTKLSPCTQCDTYWTCGCHSQTKVLRGLITPTWVSQQWSQQQEVRLR